MHSDDDARSWDSEDEEPSLTVDDPEVWMDHWSEELVTLWHVLREQAASMGAAVLDSCAFPAFAQFCWEHSSRRPPLV